MSKTSSSCLFLILASIFLPIHAQLCTDDQRFIADTYVSMDNIEIIKNISYGQAVDYKEKTTDLQLDLYIPKTKKDTLSKRPLALFIHGGGFLNGTRDYMTIYCEEFAKRGYVTATMSYRIGYDQAAPGDNLKAVYRATQDANTALSYLMQHSEKYGIDPNWVFIGGSSAGAITSFLVAYSNLNEWNMVFPNISNLLGPLKKTTDTNIPSFTIKGIFNHVGSVSPAVLADETLIPTISFHGDQDTTVPIDESPIGLGSRGIHQLMSKAGICNDITIAPGKGHNAYLTDSGLKFMIQRTACFFKSILCDTCTSASTTEDIPADCVK